MKIFVALSTLLAAATCQEAKVLATYAGYHPYAAAGYPYAAAPYAAYAPYSAGSQFHAQDEFGNLNYGYTNINSVKQEVGNAYGGVTGGYSYVDANNQLQRVEYVADGLGFRVADSRLPVAPVYDGVAPTFNPEPLVAPTFNPEPLVAPVFTGVAPEPVQDTPEVAAAKAEFLAKFDEINNREKRSVIAAGPIAHAAYPYAAYTQTGVVAGPVAPAYGDAVATPRGLRPLSLEGFSEDLDQDGFVDPIAQAVAPAVAYAAAPVAAPLAYAQAPIAAPLAYAQAPIAAATYAAAPIAAPLAYAQAPVAIGTGLPAPVAAATYGALPAVAPVAAATYAAPALAAAAPLAYAAQTISAPAAREAVLETVKLNPGHAVAYRVY